MTLTKIKQLGAGGKKLPLRSWEAQPFPTERCTECSWRLQAMSKTIDLVAAVTPEISADALVIDEREDRLEKLGPGPVATRLLHSGGSSEIRGTPCLRRMRPLHPK